MMGNSEKEGKSTDDDIIILDSAEECESNPLPNYRPPPPNRNAPMARSRSNVMCISKICPPNLNSEKTPRCSSEVNNLYRSSSEVSPSKNTFSHLNDTNFCSKSNNDESNSSLIDLSSFGTSYEPVLCDKFIDNIDFINSNSANSTTEPNNRDLKDIDLESPSEVLYNTEDISQTVIISQLFILP